MKNQTQTISDNVFAHFPLGRAGRGRTSRLIGALKERASSLKGQLQTAIATLGIGTALLVAVYLFLTQLAEYGW